MTVKIYIWEPYLGSIANILGYEFILRFLPKKFHFTNCGHAAIEIKNSSKNTIYISHSPANIEDLEKKVRQGKLLGITGVPVADNITLEHDIARIKWKPQEYRIDGLNETRMITKLENLKISGKYHYHPLDYNCCTLVAKLLKEGLECSDKFCWMCNPLNYSFAPHPYRKYAHPTFVGIPLFLFTILVQLDPLSFFAFYYSFKLLHGITSVIWTPNHLQGFIQKIITGKLTCEKMRYSNRQLNVHSGKLCLFIVEHSKKKY